MKEHQILFRTEMVRAILDGRKTMTRRVIKPQPLRSPYWTHYENSGAFYPATYDAEPSFLKCPYGKPGDRLWVRETFCYGDNVRPKIDDKIIYKADDRWSVLRWKPSIHMPKKYARIWLEITGVRVERLQAMNYYDWVADFCPYPVEKERALATFVGMDNMHQMAQKFWDSINGKKHPWESNPWVWVIKFTQVLPHPTKSALVVGENEGKSGG